MPNMFTLAITICPDDQELRISGLALEVLGDGLFVL